MNNKQLDEPFSEMTLNTNSKYEKNVWWFTLEKKLINVRKLWRSQELTKTRMTHYTKKYDESGLKGLLEENRHPVNAIPWKIMVVNDHIGIIDYLTSAHYTSSSR